MNNSKKNLKRFIFHKYDDGYYSIYKILGVKIITKPLRLKIDMLERNMRDFINTNSWKVADSVNTNSWKVADSVNTNSWNAAWNINENSWNVAANINKTSIKCIENQKNKYNMNIDEIISKSKNTLVTRVNSNNTISLLLNNTSFFENFYPKSDLIIVWSLVLWNNNTSLIEMGLHLNTPLLIGESGFINSATTCFNMKIDERYVSCVSYTFSNLPHFFADEITTLEYMLNNKEIVITKEQIERSKIVIKKIVDNKITKYNHQPIYTPVIGNKNRKKVLVVDQSYGDLSIFYGWANTNTFKNMLDRAIKDNPNSDIIIKTHPDALAEGTQRKKCYYSKEDEQENVYLMSDEINPISLLEIVDKVYVCSSQLGFEALMLGKEVHVFGMPFYAGYGLTIDYQRCERRTNTRTLEEMFYIAYIMYSYYVNPNKKCRCEIEDAIDYLIDLRKEYFLEFNIRCDSKNIL